MTRVVAVSAPRRRDDRERVALNVAYVHAVVGAGLVPLVVPPILDPRQAAEVLAAASGLVLTGGEDVAPSRYGAQPHPEVEPSDPARDAIEVALLEEARARGLPVLAICRGIQLVNVALGGTLYQHLPGEHPSAVPHQSKTARHDVRLEPGSVVQRLLGGTRHTVNSRHHQAIKRLAPGLRATAWADDEIIEAVEPADPVGGGGASWLLGVQWHPEDMEEAALFAGFAEAVRATAAAYRA